MGQLAGAAGVPSQATPVETNRVEFGLFWPPKDPTETLSPDAAPLLNGSLIVRLDALPDDGRVARLRVTLTRPSDEAGRERWNSTLAFPQYDWMRYVRVWDADKQWLWPNLPYVLRLHGIERVDRYGGVDPGKGVDDDFAAVLIRKYAGTTTNEAETTRRLPLVAAEWHPVGASMPVNKETIVHVAQSDEFSLDLGRVDGKKQGWAAVWLIYADFMGAKVPGSWPKTLEFTGGILAYFEVHWDLQAMPGHQVVLRHLTPRQSTGFDWERWARRTRVAQNPAITAKLSDLPANRANVPAPVAAPVEDLEATNAIRLEPHKTNATQDGRVPAGHPPTSRHYQDARSGLERKPGNPFNLSTFWHIRAAFYP